MNFSRLLASVALTLLALPGAATAAEEIGRGDVVVIPLKGEITKAQTLFIRRAVKSAESSGASAIVLEMNTYGGQLDAAEDITKILNRTKLPTYTFINTNAGSAGALIALATKTIYMAPVSAIGAAAPITATGEDLSETAKEKTISYWTALIRASAGRNGHNPDVGEAFMDKNKEVRIGDKLVHGKGSLLTLNSQEASEMINGKPVLAAGILESATELMQRSNLRGDLVRLEPSGFERLALWITSLAPVLLLLGMIGIYLEMKVPGASVFGVMAGVCFALFFLGHYLAGLAGWESVAIFVVGLVLILLEIFVFAHSTIIIGVIGTLLVLGSLVWAMIDRYPNQSWWPSAPMLEIPLRNIALAIIAASVGIALLARYLPRTALYRRFALDTVVPTGPSLAGASRDAAPPFAVHTGMTGTALTSLRPSGKARLLDHVIDVVTDGEFIEANAQVAVAETDGVRVVVRRAG